jgi:hypothetical protein
VKLYQIYYWFFIQVSRVTIAETAGVPKPLKTSGLVTLTSAAATLSSLKQKFKTSVDMVSNKSICSRRLYPIKKVWRAE